ncbi:MAG: ABC transporter ATP-binding protein [Mycobacteriales bacterium]
MPEPSAVLRTHALTKEFAGFRAVDGVDLTVAAGAVHALVGPNGAGKTTLFNLLTGFSRPTSGRIEVHGRDVTRLSPDRIARVGVARSFQITSLFEQLSLTAHVQLALQGTTGLGYRFWRSQRLMRRFSDEASHLLDEVGLAGLADRPAGTLAYGQKRALELALALALHPSLLLLDEPTAGMGTEDVERTIGLIDRVRRDRTVILVEHNMSVVSSLADRVTVLQRGSILAEGAYDEVRRDERVITAYLGSSVA